MIRYLLATTAVLSAGAASAGTISRSEQPVIVLFEKGGENGRYVEGAISWGKPDVTGTDSDGNSTGQVGKENWLLGAGFKMDFNDKWSGALIYDQPFGADLDYQNSSLLYGGTGGTNADVDALALTALARYKFNENFSVHGGLRVARFGADASLDGTAFGPLAGYSFEGEEDWGVGGVVGVAYEQPARALRLILTYSSEITFDLDSSEDFPAPLAGFSDGNSTTEVVLPQSLNLDFQTGVAKGTLLFGQIRWVNWDGFEVRPEALDTVAGVAGRLDPSPSRTTTSPISRSESAGSSPRHGRALSRSTTPPTRTTWAASSTSSMATRALPPPEPTRRRTASRSPAARNTSGSAIPTSNPGSQAGDPAGAEFTDNSGLALLLKVAYNF